MKIGKREINETSEPYFIANIGSNHEGSLERALSLIELAKGAGADAVKFENCTPRNLISKKGFELLKQIEGFGFDTESNPFEEYMDISIPVEWIASLAQKCEEVGIHFISAPCDFTSVELVNPYVSAFQIAYGDITWHEIISHIASKERPLILETGASDFDEVKIAVELISEKNKEFLLMQCNSNYISQKDSYKHVNLKVLELYKNSFPHAVIGFSDFAPGYSMVLASVALGAKVIEKRFTDDNQREAFEHRFSLSPSEWAEMKERGMEVFYALGDGVKRIEENEKLQAVTNRRSLYFIRKLPEGTVVKLRDIMPLRPCLENGLEPYRQSEIAGKQLKAEADEGAIIDKSYIL